jgi:DNA-binding response OmpR family regulator
MARILIVEDEMPINNLIKRNLTLVGHECVQLYDGESAVKAIWDEKFDLVLLDVMLPGLSGFDVIKQIPKTPVIFVTAKTALNDKLAGLYLGGDDYIVKPFEILELIARVESVLRRTCASADEFKVDDVTVNYSNKKVTKGGEEVYLTPREFSLLETLIINRNIALSREKLIDLVWSTDFDGDMRTVDVHIQRLRTKLGLENRIKTVYRLGYRFEI